MDDKGNNDQDVDMTGLEGDDEDVDMDELDKADESQLSATTIG